MDTQPPIDIPPTVPEPLRTQMLEAKAKVEAMEQFQRAVAEASIPVEEVVAAPEPESRAPHRWSPVEYAERRRKAKVASASRRRNRHR